MKKLIIFTICLSFALSVVFVPTVAAFETKFTENGTEYVAHQLIVTTNYMVDTSLYDGTEPKDFCGVSVKSIEFLLQYTPPQEWFDKYGYVSYIVYLEPSVDELEAIEVLSANDDVLRAKLNTVAYPSDPVVKTGDVNGNGKIDARDYLLLKRAYFGTYNLTCEIETADINGNGKLDARDYLLLKRAYFGTYTIGTPDATPDEA